MKRKIVFLVICMLLITTLASNITIAIKCERNPITYSFKTNSPPNPPTVKIPKIVRTGGLFYIKAITTDPDNDNIYYRYSLFDVETEWIGPYQSGEEYLEFIIGIPTGNYTLGVQAKDNYDAESDWTFTDFTVVNYKSIMPSYFYFVQNHLNLLSILQKLLQT